MRRIGTISIRSQAENFRDYLTTQSIESNLDEDTIDGAPTWAIWIREENQVQQARQELKEFQASPDDQKYQVKEDANRIREERVALEQRRLKYQKKFEPKRTPSVGNRLQSHEVRQSNIPVTIAIIVICCLLHFCDLFQISQSAGESSYRAVVVEYLSFVSSSDWQATAGDSYASIKNGDYWRVITPTFLHGDEIHLLFNMMWIYSLGSVIERLHGSFFLVVAVLVCGVVGIFFQVLLPPASELPRFLESFAGSTSIGASGVVFGLFGFLWLRPYLDSDYPIQMSGINVMIMFGWLFLCMTPLIKNVANGGHLGGLLTGILIAYLSTLVKPSSRKT